MKTYEIAGTYGNPPTPCTVLCATVRDGRTWYTVEGSANVNLAPEPLEWGADVEAIQDLDCFTWPDGVNDLEELERAIEA